MRPVDSDRARPRRAEPGLWDRIPFALYVAHRTRLKMKGSNSKEDLSYMRWKGALFVVDTRAVHTYNQLFS